MSLAQRSITEKDNDMNNFKTETKAAAREWFEANVAKGRRGKHCFIDALTPARAEILLRKNPDNRTKKTWHIEEMAGDIDEGRFDFTGQSVVVSTCGLLNDGQNRCEAVALADQPIEVVFVFGVDREARKRMDIGRVRTVADFLSMDGENHAANLAAACHYILKIKKYGKIPSGMAQRISKAELVNSAHDMLDDLHLSLNHCKQHGHGRVAPLSLLMTAHFFFSQVDPVAADDFINDLVQGAGLAAGDPVFVVRDKLMDRKKRLNNNEKLKALYMAWNNRRMGNKVRSLTHALSRAEKLPALKS